MVLNDVQELDENALLRSSAGVILCFKIQRCI